MPVCTKCLEPRDDSDFNVRKCKFKHIPFDLSFDDYVLITVGRRCHYCGGQLPEAGHGLDRINRNYGYLRQNVVPCCKECNAQKGYLEGAGFPLDRVLELMHELKQANITISLEARPLKSYARI
jgi:hypothetical protein